MLVAPCLKGFEWGLEKIGLRTVTAFWAGIAVEVAQKAGVVPRCRCAAIGCLLVASYDTQGNGGRIYHPRPHGLKSRFTSFISKKYEEIGSENYSLS